MHCRKFALNRSFSNPNKQTHTGAHTHPLTTQHGTRNIFAHRYVIPQSNLWVVAFGSDAFGFAPSFVCNISKTTTTKTQNLLMMNSAPKIGNMKVVVECIFVCVCVLMVEIFRFGLYSTKHFLLWLPKVDRSTRSNQMDEFYSEPLIFYGPGENAKGERRKTERKRRSLFKLSLLTFWVIIVCVRGFQSNLILMLNQ